LFAAGWALRLQGDSTACAICLAQFHTHNERVAQLLELVSEAESFLAPPGNEAAAAEFFSEIARLADRLILAAYKEDLRDRALMAIAAKMRQRVLQGTGQRNLVSSFLDRASVWPLATISDADFAVQLALRQPSHAWLRQKSHPAAILPGRVAKVTAVCWARESGDIFFGLASGEVFCFRPERGEIIPLPPAPFPIASVATDPGGKLLVILAHNGSTSGALSSFRKAEGGFFEVVSSQVKVAAHGWLCPDLGGKEEPIAAFWNGLQLRFLRGARLLPVANVTLFSFDSDPCALVFIPGNFQHDTGELAVLVFDGQRVAHFGDFPNLKLHKQVSIFWGPSIPGPNSLGYPPLSWMGNGSDTLEVAGLAKDGKLFASRFQFQNGAFIEVTTRTEYFSSPYLAVSHVRPGLLAAVSATTVDWVALTPDVPRLKARTEIAVPNAVSCFPLYRSDEILVVCTDGKVARVPFHA
jgi:hypothetical protein